MTKRARKGGEVGRNGEFYEGGKFLPSTRLPKQGTQGRKSGSGRVLVEPGIVATIPEGRVAIYPQIRHFVTFVEGKAVPKYADDHHAMTYQWEDAAGIARFHRLVERFNRFERHYPKGEE